jgi:uncharacterized protein YyaL (SSP411 family)
MDDIWKNRRSEVNESSNRLAEAIGRFTAPTFGQSELNESLLKNAEQAMLSAHDRVQGGFGGAPKFPHPIDLRVLLRTWKRFGNQSALDAVVLSLEKMAGGGIYDHLGGGFHRYSTDTHWLVPHFEKMLYDNALLVPAYLEAYQATGREDFARIVRETLDYVLREMTSPEGGFYSTQDADSEGTEGRYFVWTPEEIHEVLGEEDGQLFCASFDVTPEGNWEGHSILNRPKPLAQIAKERRIPIEELSATLEFDKHQLRERRSTRIAPGRDEKILIAWNGLMISAMSMGARILKEPRFLRAAQQAAKFILTQMRDHSSREARLFHCHKEGASKFNAYLDDYACLIDGLIDLYQTDFDATWLSEARALAAFMQKHFADPRTTSSSIPATITKRSSIAPKRSRTTRPPPLTAVRRRCCCDLRRWKDNRAIPAGGMLFRRCRG